jgi:hypothetical protein
MKIVMKKNFINFQEENNNDVSDQADQSYLPNCQNIPNAMLPTSSSTDNNNLLLTSNQQSLLTLATVLTNNSQNIDRNLQLQQQHQLLQQHQLQQQQSRFSIAANPLLAEKLLQSSLTNLNGRPPDIKGE